MHYTILTHIYRDADHKQQYFRETHPKHKSERRENLCKLVKPTDVTYTCQCTSHNVPKFGIPAHMHCVHCMQMNNNNFGKLQLCFTQS